jgi:poly-gamma-glutamate synthesis protein (capsule biosynthesis protein)
MQENGDDFIFSCLAGTLHDADLVVANLEGPITSHGSMSLGSTIGTPENFTFTFPTSSAALLKRSNISLVSLGNNHILNFGGDGVRETKEWLGRAGVRHFGDPYVSENDRVARLDIEGLRFSFISWSDWTGGKREDVVQQIEKETRDGRWPIIVAHWGDEYEETTGGQQQLARAFVDAGAKLVLGGHPHVVQEREYYKGVPIYYSLGNFVFDQYWNEDVRTGLLVRVMFDEEGIYGIDEIPVYLESDRRTCLQEKS